MLSQSSTDDRKKLFANKAKQQKRVQNSNRKLLQNNLDSVLEFCVSDETT